MQSLQLETDRARAAISFLNKHNTTIGHNLHKHKCLISRIEVGLFMDGYSVLLSIVFHFIGNSKSWKHNNIQCFHFSSPVMICE